MKIDKLAEQFRNEYKAAFEKVGNNLAVGIGLDPKSKTDTIEVRLTNNKLKNTLPAEYHGAKVNILVVGVIRAL